MMRSSHFKSTPICNFNSLHVWHRNHLANDWDSLLESVIYLTVDGDWSILLTSNVHWIEREIFISDMNQVQTSEAKKFYCCVTCGTPVDELSHQYKEGVIKIIHCVSRLTFEHRMASISLSLCRNNARIPWIPTSSSMICWSSLISSSWKSELIAMSCSISRKFNPV